MSSLAELKEHSIVEFAEPPELSPDQDIIAFLNEQLEKVGLPQTIKPLEVLALPKQTEKNPFHVPETLTPEQASAILYMAPGFASVDIGQLNKNTRLHEMGMPDRPMAYVSLVVTLESHPTAENFDSMTMESKGHSKVTVWDVYGVDKRGTITYFGVQT